MHASSLLKKCPASHRCVGSGEYKEVELRRQTPIVDKFFLAPSIYSRMYFVGLLVAAFKYYYCIVSIICGITFFIDIF